MVEIEKKLTQCPYCGCEINNNAEKCPNCNEWFVEPHIEGFKIISIPIFLAVSALFQAAGLCYMFCSLLWVLINIKVFFNLAINKDSKKLKMLLTLFVIALVLTLYSKRFYSVCIIVNILLSYRLLRIIEKYTLKKYKSPITHHELGMIFFRILYVIYYLDTYKQRVYDPNHRYCLEAKKWFEYFILCLLLSFMLGFRFGHMPF